MHEEPSPGCGVEEGGGEHTSFEFAGRFSLIQKNCVANDEQRKGEGRFGDRGSTHRGQRAARPHDLPRGRSVECSICAHRSPLGRRVWSGSSGGTHNPPSTPEVSKMIDLTFQLSNKSFKVPLLHERELRIELCDSMGND